MASTLIEDATVGAIENALRRLDAAATDPGDSIRRTRVATHIAWVPAPWEEAARATLAGLGDRHPSRTIFLLPDPDSDRDVIDAEVEVRVFNEDTTLAIASEVVILRLRGHRALAPASVVAPLLVSDLPVFLRWRGPLPFGSRELEQLIGVIDRLIVDSGEWPMVTDAYRYLPAFFPRTCVSDIAWTRTGPWRAAIARLWPAVRDAERITARAPAAEAHLLAGWLRSRLGREILLEHEPGPDLEHVEIDGQPVHPVGLELLTSSDLLSSQFEIHVRDAVYEGAVVAAG